MPRGKQTFENRPWEFTVIGASKDDVSRIVHVMTEIKGELLAKTIERVEAEKEGDAK